MHDSEQEIIRTLGMCLLFWRRVAQTHLKGSSVTSINNFRE